MPPAWRRDITPLYGEITRHRGTINCADRKLRCSLRRCTTCSRNSRDTKEMLDSDSLSVWPRAPKPWVLCAPCAWARVPFAESRQALLPPDPSARVHTITMRDITMRVDKARTITDFQAKLLSPV